MDEMRKREIGANIKKLREAHGMSQTELARRIGKTAAAISQYESGETTPRIGVIEDMAALFGVPKSLIISESNRYEASEKLSDSEQELIDLYRSTDARGRDAIMAVARSQAGDEGASEAGARSA